MKTNERAEERKPFKDWFNRQAARSLGKQLKRGHPNLNLRKFVDDASKGLDGLEMMGRVTQFAQAMRTHLPQHLPEALRAITEGLPPERADAEAVTNGYLQWPVGQFIADYCVDHPEEAFPAMYELTKRFSSEFAVRPFLERHPRETFRRLQAWSTDENVHVRRWCSEGCRPRLPWGRRVPALIADPSPILPILERLKDDPELYVRKSVANNLNDIAKSHPELALETCRRWKKGASERRRWVIKHALRGLIKAGDRKALRIVGFGAPPPLDVTLSVRPRRLRIGETAVLKLVLENESTKDHELLIDFRVHYLNAKRQAKKPKVFKWTTLEIGARGTVELSKKLEVAHTTTRRLHPGEHVIDLQINGTIVAKTALTLS